MSDALHFDVLIVGGGPSGLACAIQFGRFAKQNGLSVALLEKGGDIGDHLLSGAIVDPSALNALGIEWQNCNPYGRVTEEAFWYLSATKARTLWTPMGMRNTGLPMMSLGHLCKMLAQEAEELGVHIFSGFPAIRLLEEQGRVVGVQTQNRGMDKKGRKTEAYQEGVGIYAKYTVLAEGCRGNVSQEAIKRYDLANKASPPTYGLGIREVWQIDTKHHKPGLAIHTVGWPLTQQTHGGGFIYHTHDQHVIIGYITALDYENPKVDPHQEMQMFKTHPAIASILENGKRLRYGARTMADGGYQSLPTLVFPGGMLVGDSAGFLNTGRLKGIHSAMFSGIYAADALIDHFDNTPKAHPSLLTQYPCTVQQSPMYTQLYQIRNIRPAFQKGKFFGMAYAALTFGLLKGREPWTWSHHNDHNRLNPAKIKDRDYPTADQHLVFDKASSVALAQIFHEENQPCHLHIAPNQGNLSAQFGYPECHYCPAGVYEQQHDGRMVVHPSQCLHCKTCDIKDPGGNIRWMPPQGGEGPHYDD